MWEAAKKVLTKAGYDPKIVASQMREKAFDPKEAALKEFTYADSLKVL